MGMDRDFQDASEWESPIEEFDITTHSESSQVLKTPMEPKPFDLIKEGLEEVLETEKPKKKSKKKGDK